MSVRKTVNSGMCSIGIYQECLESKDVYHRNFLMLSWFDLLETRLVKMILALTLAKEVLKIMVGAKKME